MYIAQRLDEVITKLEKALEYARDHLEEEEKNPQTHPIGHCPTLHIVREALQALQELKGQVK